VNFSGAQCQEADFKSTQCQGAYALKKFYSQELRSTIDTAHPKNSPLDTVHPQNAPLDTVQNESSPLGTVQNKNPPLDTVIKNIENAKKYLSESWCEDLQTIIQDNKSKEPKYGTPELNSCE
jgi:uncharacterized protein YjbI with pentapeptide repeats